MAALELKNINIEFAPEKSMRCWKFSVISICLLIISAIMYLDISCKLAVNIYISHGNVYEKRISVNQPGEYTLTFDLHTDENTHYVSLSEDGNLVRRWEFKSAYGLVSVPIAINKEAEIRFESGKEGWMKVTNSYVVKDQKKIPLYNYVLLPTFIEQWENDRGRLSYYEESSLNEEVVIGKNNLEALEPLHVRVIRQSNLSHMLEFDYKSVKKVAANYQLELLMNYRSITTMLPEELERNVWHQRLTLYPYTSQWEVGKEYTVKAYRLFSSEDFNLCGRYYDMDNKVFSQDSYFPINYKVEKENQEITPMGESQWIIILYAKDKENNIPMNYNGWVESPRMNLPPGDYTLTFTAQGSYYEGYPEIRFRDSSLHEFAKLTLDGTMKQYTVTYHVDEPKEGVSFLLELTNYATKKDVGNRMVLLKETLLTAVKK